MGPNSSLEPACPPTNPQAAGGRSRTLVEKGRWSEPRLGARTGLHRAGAGGGVWSWEKGLHRPPEPPSSCVPATAPRGSIHRTSDIFHSEFPCENEDLVWRETHGREEEKTWCVFSPATGSHRLLTLLLHGLWVLGPYPGQWLVLKFCPAVSVGNVAGVAGCVVRLVVVGGAGGKITHQTLLPPQPRATQLFESWGGGGGGERGRHGSRESLKPNPGHILGGALRD